MQDAPDLTVVVLSWNTRDLTIAALEAVGAAAAPCTVQTLCVDNASEDRTVEEVTRRLPDVHVLALPTNVGFARGNDAALPHVRGRVVVFLNSDTRAMPGSLAHLVRYLDEHPAVGIVAPALVSPDGSRQRAAWGVPSARALLHRYTPLGWFGFGAAEDRRTRPPRDASESTGRVEAVNGACLAIRRDLCERLGGFDPGYPFYVEDVDLCWRARREGAEVHVAVDGPPVLHVGGASTALADGATRLPLLQGWLRLQRKVLSPRAYACFAPTFKLGVVVRTMTQCLTAGPSAALRQMRMEPDRARTVMETAAERVRFLERDLPALLRSEVGDGRPVPFPREPLRKARSTFVSTS